LEITLELIKQVCRGLKLAHQQAPPIIHRDIKPANILVGYASEGLRARVSDFGLAKEVNPLTLRATAAGTLAFKAPEALHESKGDSATADVWSIGVTLYLMLTNQLPYEIPAHQGWAVGRNVNTGEFIPASGINSKVSIQLDEIIHIALSQNPKDRYKNAAEMLKALEKGEGQECNDYSVKPGLVSGVSENRNPNEKSTSKGKSPEDLKSREIELIKKTLTGFSHYSFNKDKGLKLAKEALELVKVGHLTEGADLMEEAFNKWPELRGKYANMVKLWRCGVSM